MIIELNEGTIISSKNTAWTFAKNRAEEIVPIMQLIAKDAVMDVEFKSGKTYAFYCIVQELS